MSNINSTLRSVSKDIQLLQTHLELKDFFGYLPPIIEKIHCYIEYQYNDEGGSDPIIYANGIELSNDQLLVTDWLLGQVGGRYSNSKDSCCNLATEDRYFWDYTRNQLQSDLGTLAKDKDRFFEELEENLAEAVGEDLYELDGDRMETYFGTEFELERDMSLLVGERLKDKVREIIQPLEDILDADP